jgi:hypothetical protein
LTSLSRCFCISSFFFDTSAGTGSWFRADDSSARGSSCSAGLERPPSEPPLRMGRTWHAP